MIFWKLLITFSAVWTSSAKIHGGEQQTAHGHHQEEEEEVGLDGHNRELYSETSSWSSSDYDVPPSNRWIPDLVAFFDDRYNLEGTVAVKQVDETQGTWEVRIDKIVIDTTLCPGFTGELNWHIHARPAIEGDEDNCGPTITGGHYDPTYACGPASDFAGDVCNYLETNTRPYYEYPEICSPETPAGCELGDLSGKSGRVDATALGQFQRFDDYWLGSVDDIKGLSIVFHCCIDSGGCGPRVACANLKPRRYW